MFMLYVVKSQQKARVKKEIFTRSPGLMMKVHFFEWQQRKGKKVSLLEDFSGGVL